MINSFRHFITAKTTAFNQFMPGILLFFPVPRTGLFSGENSEQISSH